jgi:putative membrane protein
MTSALSDRKLHPVSFVFEIASHTRQLLLPGLFVLIAGARGSDSWQIYGMLLFVPVALLSVARALVFRYQLQADELEIRSGLIVKQQRHIPYGRIQNIDAVQNVFHRALRVVEVRLETAGGEEPEALLKVVSQAAFDELRTRVAEARARLVPVTPAQVESPGELPAESTAPVSGPAEAAAPQPITLLHLPARELVTCGLIQGRGLIVIGALFGLLWETGIMDRLTGRMFGDAIEGRGVARQLVGAVFGQGIPSPGKIALTLGAFVLFLLATRVFSIAWALVRLHGFRLRRIGDDVRVDFGLFTRVSATIPLRRIQSVTIHNGPLHRWFDRVSVHVQTAGGKSDQSVQLQRQWLAPVIRPDEALRLVDEILPGIPARVEAWQPVDPRGLRRMRMRGLTLAAAASLMLFGTLGWWMLAVFCVLAALAEVNARRSIGALGWAFSGRSLSFRSGWMWRQQTVAPVSKIQVVAIEESPFDRRHAMARVAVDTAGTSQNIRRIAVPYLARSTAESLAGDLAEQAGRTTFQW